MNVDGISRRRVLLASSVALLSRRVDAQHRHEDSAERQPRDLQFFSKEEAREIESLAALIIPTDETPGAREAGVIHFIDTALATFDGDKQTIYRNGLQLIQTKIQKLDTRLQHVTDLNPDQQLQLMEQIRHSEFFEVLRTHTVMGFFGTQARGGNKDNIGWKLIGFEDRFTFEPPFGYYDAEPAFKSPDV